MNTLLDNARVAVVHGEALEVLRRFPDKHFDMILTDPPYSPHAHAKLGKERRNDGHQAREELAFPPMTDDLIAAFAAEYVRVCKGWILSFSDYLQSRTWGKAVEDAGGCHVRTGYWIKTNPMPQMTGDRPGTGAEDIVIAHAARKGFVWNGRGRAAVWRGPRDRDAVHPNQKPLWLVQALLGLFAPPGGLVCDPFFGAGTTAVAALRPERVLGEVCVETACKACAQKRVEENAPPLPVNLCVVGIEGDLAWATKAVERIRNAAGS